MDADATAFSYKKQMKKRQRERRSQRRKDMHATRTGVAYQDPAAYGQKLKKESVREQKRYTRRFWSKETLMNKSSSAASSDLELAKKQTSTSDKYKVFNGQNQSDERQDYNKLVDNCFARAKHALGLLERADLLNDRFKERNVTPRQVIVERKIVKN